MQADLPAQEDDVANSYQEVVLGVPGLTNYYPLDAEHGARDIVGGRDGTICQNVVFKEDGAHFDGDSWIDLGDADEFSVTTTRELTIVAELTVADWSRKAANNEYLHWMGKGYAGQHEWTFRTYIDGGGGEAPQRKRRISFYHFNPDGGLGTGSYVQDSGSKPGVPMTIGGMVTTKGSGSTPGYTAMYYNGVQRDKDNLTAYSTKPVNTRSSMMIGSRGDGTGALVGTIRRVAVFNRLLTDAEMQLLHTSQSLPETDGGGVDPGPEPQPQPGDVVVGWETHPVDAVNAYRGTDMMVLYTPEHGATTGTSEWGTEAVYRNGRVQEIRTYSGNTPIPADGAVLSGHGKSREWIENFVREGMRATRIPEDGGGTPEPPDNSAQIAALRDEAQALRAAANSIDAIADSL